MTTIEWLDGWANIGHPCVYKIENRLSDEIKELQANQIKIEAKLDFITQLLREK